MDKRASDAWDLYRLLLDLDRNGDLCGELDNAPSALRRLVATATDSVLMAGATRTVGWLRAGNDQIGAVTAAELRHLATPVVTALTS